MALEWGARLDGVDLAAGALDRVVLDWLINQGYAEAARTFCAESSLCGAAVQVEEISARVALKEDLVLGRVGRAIEAAYAVDEQIFENDRRLLFELHRQQLIELIRSGDVPASLVYAHDKLAPLVEQNPDFLPDLEEVMMLLASADASRSPSAHLLSAQQRRDVANKLNEAVLRAQGHEEHPSLLVLLRALRWAQAELRDRMSVNFPVIDDLRMAMPALESSANSPLGRRRPRSAPSEAL